ncbi:MAG: hypothetical protein IJX39_07070 [Clostridia bacterium]|nr:hypothetical protein [Clostridia bacterium]
MLTLLAIPFHLLGGRTWIGYLFSFLLNTCGMCCSMTAYYNMSGLSCARADLLPAVLLPLTLLLCLCVLLTVFSESKEPIVAIAVLLEVALLVASVVFWAKRGGDFYAFSLFAHLIVLFYTTVFGVTVGEEERGLLRDISFGSFGAFLLVAAAALIAVTLIAGDGCDCDCNCGDCDCSSCDCGPSDFGKNTKTKRAR